MIQPNERIEAIVFPESGIVSIVASTEDHRRVEIGIIGREGMTDGSILIGVDRVPHEVFVQVAGSGMRIDAAALLALVAARPAIRVQLLPWLHILTVQAAQTALSNAGYDIEARLARWLLMCQDRVDSNEIPLTHEFLGVMLAVRRSSVTLATHMLEGAKIIKAERGRITILDREALKGLAGNSYGTSEAEYERLLGPFRG
ncbi:Crp/Fnr family transcriptional regulator [Aurantimonas marina]|uniref:Crp/Fnr family transcriptional regulator n=1 Tax=Aurantimonas marina TaxID=2780508 RepID=UPI001E509459|nr:Crp/Fnr family transcriptional regulator [Aurantimonas marina]